MKFTVFYRGQFITEIEAKTVKAAETAYYKQWSKGSSGTAVFVPSSNTFEQNKAAIEASKVVPGKR